MPEVHQPVSVIDVNTDATHVHHSIRQRAAITLTLAGLSVVTTGLCGCGSLGQKLTFLRPPISANVAHVETLKSAYSKDEDVQSFYLNGSVTRRDKSGTVTSVESLSSAYSTAKARRNKIINDLLFLINDYYSAYELSWYATAVGHGFLSDITTLGLDTAATATGTATVKTMLTAISTGVGGQKIAVQRDFFQNQNIALIIKNMRAGRGEVLSKIRSQTSKDVDEYSLEDALLDLQEYFLAGTVIGGIQHADDTAALQKIVADEAAAQGERVSKLTTARTSQTTEETATSIKREKSKLFEKLRTVSSPEVADAAAALGISTTESGQQLSDSQLRARLRLKIASGASLSELESIRAALSVAH
jgi:hypothetical protein